jgi:D-alanyl-lipoteichoic acid acyltransferase DltB (MBOAT superfamily)
MAAIGMEKYEKHKKKLLICSLFMNLTILFFFKYFNWMAENLSSVMDALGVAIAVPKFNVLLPVGISFYIFQALGYSIDVYRDSVRVERNFFVYALFVSFFPQLVAGPIERSTNLLQQFYKKHRFDGDKAITGIQLVLWGYFLKIVVADNLSLYVDEVYNHLEVHSGSDILYASVLFCFQLYGDFAGYSYIAIGVSRVLGFKLMDNFLRPYFFSTSIQEYWKRNHISLTTWFMDYVYYPMVGSSISLYWWCFCIFITFVISGVWHGANWTYVVSFSVFGLYLVVCLLKDKRQKKFEKKYHLKNKEIWLWLNRIITFVLLLLPLMFFRANQIGEGFYALLKMCSDLSPRILYYDFIFYFQKGVWMILFLLFVVEYCVEYKKTTFVQRHFLLSHIAMSGILLILILALGEFNGGQFIYFQF